MGGRNATSQRRRAITLVELVVVVVVVALIASVAIASSFSLQNRAAADAALEEAQAHLREASAVARADDHSREVSGEDAAQAIDSSGVEAAGYSDGVWVFGDGSEERSATLDLTSAEPEAYRGLPVGAVMVDATSMRSAAVGADGRVYVAGDNSFGTSAIDGGIAVDRFIGAESPPAPVADMAIGTLHTLTILDDGSVWVVGSNGSGELGLGDEDRRTSFEEAGSAPDDPVAVAAGPSTSFVITADGDVYAAGMNDDGQLGVGDTDNRDTFTPVDSLASEEVTAIAASRYFTFAVTADGGLYVTGSSAVGALGTGDTDDRESFEPVTTIPEGRDIVDVDPGLHHTVALDADGQIYTTGWDTDGQLGYDPEERYSQPAWARFEEPDDSGAHTFVAVSAGSRSTHAVDDDGNLWVTGDNDYGQLGLGNTESQDTLTPVGAPAGIVAVEAGTRHVVLQDADGQVWTAGRDARGELAQAGPEDDESLSFAEVVDPEYDG